MTLSRRPLRSSATSGFTLIEIMAVVAIMAMIFAIGVPRLNVSKWRLLRNESESIAASLEYARQRAIMTGAPHRVLIDLEHGAYRVEWLVTKERAFAALSENGSGEVDVSSYGLANGPPLKAELPDLKPPQREERDFYPVANNLGSFTQLDDALYFVGLESSAGWVEGGSVEIVFDPDGTTEYSLLEIADSDDHHMTLEIEPLLDRVRRRDGAARS